VNTSFLVVGSFILVYTVDLNNPDLFLGSFFLAVVLLLVTVIAGVAWDTATTSAARVSGHADWNASA
jgi:hypothetical protein